MFPFIQDTTILEILRLYSDLKKDACNKRNSMRRKVCNHDIFSYLFHIYIYTHQSFMSYFSNMDLQVRIDRADHSRDQLIGHLFGKYDAS